MKWCSNTSLGNITWLYWSLEIVSDEVQFGKNAFTLGNYCDIMDMRNEVAIWFYDKVDSLYSNHNPDNW